MLRHVVENGLLVKVELSPRAQRDESLPDVEAQAKVGVSQHVLVADSRARIPRRIRVKRIPILYSRDLEHF